MNYILIIYEKMEVTNAGGRLIMTMHRHLAMGVATMVTFFVCVWLWLC